VGGSFGCGDANGTCSDRSAGLAVDGDGIDLRSGPPDPDFAKESGSGWLLVLQIE